MTYEQAFIALCNCCQTGATHVEWGVWPSVEVFVAVDRGMD